MSSHPSQTSRMLLVLAWATVVGITPISASEKDQVPSASTSERFEGYLFMDVDGHPLPFQSDEEIEERLRNAAVVSQSKIPAGVSRPKKVLLEIDAHRFNAVYKFIDEKKKNIRDPTSTGEGKLYLEWRDSYIYDVAAYHVDRLLGLDRAPPIVLRTVKGTQGSLQIWLEGTITENRRREEAIKPPEIARFNQQRSTLTLFDNLVANRDSNLGNTLIDGRWRLWFIDCSRCFGTSADLLYPDAITHCDRQVWNALKKLDRSSADAALSPYLSRLEIEVLFKRRDKLVELIQGRIDEWGDALVLFDQRPPTESAPWVGE
jgi:hypothetical protein